MSLASQLLPDDYEDVCSVEAHDELKNTHKPGAKYHGDALSAPISVLTAQKLCFVKFKLKLKENEKQASLPHKGHIHGGGWMDMTQRRRRTATRRRRRRRKQRRRGTKWNLIPTKSELFPA